MAGSKTHKKTPALNGAGPTHPLARCRPRGDRVVVQRDTAKKQTAVGILLPDSVTESKEPIGTVIAVGPGRRGDDGKLVPLDLKVGDRVILTGYAGLEIRENARTVQEEYVILREEDVLAVLDY